MQIQMTGKNVEVTEALKEYTEKRLQKIETHFDKVISIHVTFSIDHVEQVVDGQVTIPGNNFHAKANSEESMYNAIDAMADKLLRQIEKFRDKQTEHR